MAEEKRVYYEILINDSTLNESGFTAFKLPLNGNNNNNNSNDKKAKMILWNKEDKIKITYADFYRSDFEKSIKSLEEKLVSEQHVDNITIENLVTLYRNECQILKEDKHSIFFKNGGNGGSSSNRSSKGKQQQQQSKDGQKETKTIFGGRYARDNLIAEAIIVAGRPMFAMAMGTSITLEDAIELVEDNNNNNNNTIIKPFEFQSYINKAYTFKSKEEFKEVLENVKTKNLDSLYRKVKSIWQKYIDADDFHLSLCAADTLFTYFQDKIGLTHYLFFVGGNDSGKSNNLTIFQFLVCNFDKGWQI